MEPDQDQDSAGFILARQIGAAAPGVTVRHSDSHGPGVLADPRLREQLQVITGRRLSQFSIGVNGTGLAFWGEAAGTVSREIFIEHPTIVLGLPGEPAIAHDPASDAVATALLSVLNKRASQITVTGGQLTISFETGLTLKADQTSTTSPGRSAQATDCPSSAHPAATSPSGIHPAASYPEPFTRQPGATSATTPGANHLTNSCALGCPTQVTRARTPHAAEGSRPI